MLRRPPRSTRTDTLFPYTTRFRSDEPSVCSNGRTSISLATGMTLAKPYDGTGECRADGGSAFGPGSFFGSTKSKAPTYNFGVDWAVSDDAFFYVTTRRGYRAGALNTPRLADRKSTRLNSSH